MNNERIRGFSTTTNIPGFEKGNVLVVDQENKVWGVSVPVVNFILIGVGGYVARKHLEAIKATGGTLIAAIDKHDSVGVLDSYFPDCEFFTEWEIFDRHCCRLIREGTAIHYVVVCSPNYLHDSHCRFGLRIGADVICEKPLCLRPENAIALQEMERETGNRVWNILQLRLHPAIVALKAQPIFRSLVNLEYITARGKWYDHSWKGDVAKSGGLCMNIGIHFFDVLLWLFGEVQPLSVKAEYNCKHFVRGSIELEMAYVDWFLSTNDQHELPAGKRSHRILTIDEEVINFTEGFDTLHIKSYEEILAGRGFGIEDALPAIRLVNEINEYANAE